MTKFPFQNYGQIEYIVDAVLTLDRLHTLQGLNFIFHQSNIGPNMYCQVSNIRRKLVGNKIVDHSDVVGASPVGAAPTTSSFST